MVRRFAAVKTAVGAVALTGAVLLAGCGGGGGGSSGGGAKKSGLKSNELIGNLPAITADYRLAEESARETFKAAEAKATKSNNAKAYAKAKETYEQAQKDIDAKFEEAKKAEWAKINGKEIPVSATDAFKKLKFEAVSAKLDGDKMHMSIVITPTEDFTVTAYSGNLNEYRSVYYKVLAKDGSVITDDATMLPYVTAIKPAKFVKGTPVKSIGDEDMWGNITINNPEKWVDFASIQFVTLNETR